MPSLLKVKDQSDRRIDSYDDIGEAEIELEAWAAALTRTGRAPMLGVYLCHEPGATGAARGARVLMIGRHDGGPFAGIPGEVRQLARQYSLTLRRGDELPAFRTAP